MQIYALFGANHEQAVNVIFPYDSLCFRAVNDWPLRNCNTRPVSIATNVVLNLCCCPPACRFKAAVCGDTVRILRMWCRISRQPTAKSHLAVGANPLACPMTGAGTLRLFENVVCNKVMQGTLSMKSGQTSFGTSITIICFSGSWRAFSLSTLEA